MNKPYFEQIVLFVSIIKWAILASIVGVITGLSTSLFLNVLKITSKSYQSFDWYFLLLPVTLFLSSFIVKYLAPDAEGHGTEKVLDAIHKRSGKIKLAVVPVKLTATIITLAGGGSAGKEGPCAQIGAGLASSVADVLKLNDEDRKKIVICGISAGFATVFGTPLAGAIFAVEVLIVGRVLLEYLFPALVAAIVGYKTALFLGIPYFHTSIVINEALHTDLYFKALLSGIFFGLIALLLIELLKYFEKLSAKLKWWKPLKGLLGGAILVTLVLLLKLAIGDESTRYLGLGTNIIDGIFDPNINEQIFIYDFLLKILFTVITLSFGGSGGILTPIFFIGATAGYAFSQIFGFGYESLFAAIGLVAMLSAAANTPISAMIMSIQMFGLDIAPFAAISVIVSYIITGYRSVYPSQVVGSLKSKSISVPMMKEFREFKGFKITNDDNVINKLRKKRNIKNDKGAVD